MAILCIFFETSSSHLYHNHISLTIEIHFYLMIKNRFDCWVQYIHKISKVIVFVLAANVDMLPLEKTRLMPFRKRTLGGLDQLFSIS